MSNGATGRPRFLRASRLGGPVTLGVDGRRCEPDDPLSGTVGGSPEDTAEAAGIVEQARRHADEALRRAALEATGIRQQAQQVGYDEGYASGATRAQAELAQALALVQRVAGEGKAIRDDLMRRAEAEMVEMVIASLQAIVGDLVAQNPALVETTVRRALARAGSQNVVRIRVHPEQADQVAVLARVGEATGAVAPFEVTPDGAVSVGGCIVDTAHGRIDARLDTQLDAIARLLRDALPTEPSPIEEAEDAA